LFTSWFDLSVDPSKKKESLSIRMKKPKLNPIRIVIDVDDGIKKIEMELNNVQKYKLIFILSLILRD